MQEIYDMLWVANDKWSEPNNDLDFDFVFGMHGAC